MIKRCSDGQTEWPSQQQDFVIHSQSFNPKPEALSFSAKIMAASPSSLLLPLGASIKTSSTIHTAILSERVRGVVIRCPNDSFRVKASMARQYVDGVNLLASRREVIGLVLGVPSIFLYSSNGKAAGLPPEEKPRLCDDACVKELENVPMVTTPSGLQYKDIVVGGGPSPPVGFQVAANYVAMVPSGQIFDSSLEKGVPYIFRVGSGQVVPGLDEGILSMKVGGKRRIYIPGALAFPKGLTSAPGRPRVAPNSPVVFDVSLEFIPGLDDEE